MLNFIAPIEVEGKPEPKDYEFNGRKGTTYKLNISQNDGCDTATLPCTEAVYHSVKRHDKISVLLVYNDANERNPLKIDSIVPFDSKDKPSAPSTPAAPGTSAKH